MASWKNRPKSENIEDNRYDIPRNDRINPKYLEELSYPTQSESRSFLIDTFKQARAFGFKMPWNSFQKAK